MGFFVLVFGVVVVWERVWWLLTWPLIGLRVSLRATLQYIQSMICRVPL